MRAGESLARHASDPGSSRPGNQTQQPDGKTSRHHRLYPHVHLYPCIHAAVGRSLCEVAVGSCKQRLPQKRTPPPAATWRWSFICGTVCHGVRAFPRGVGAKGAGDAGDHARVGLVVA